ncbi:hypothetical protein EJ04DRAFT_504900 [Polyplosphaeria fusca]|uniref:Sodium/calcium exchanger membrane region domain-containing protein n=1 Tax=Polyplosphaeria fusca TaxID=682080 RepID=A0A9P4UX75_9PLEO|nr:hypothetical protein EJ04DRAFT_504900 [Polyplosphaeria fusca]
MGTGSRVVQIAATWREKARPLQPDLRDIAFRYTNIGFVFVVIGFVVQYTHQSPSLIFSFNLLAVFPSSVLLGVGLKSMGHRYGPVIQAVLYMTFGNAVQLITSVILLKNRQIKLLQTSLIGGILSNMHLMLGIGFLLGGVSRMEQFYNLTIAQVYSSLLLPSVTGLVLPTATEKLAKPVPNGIIGQSRTIAIIFLLIYLFLLFFQLKSHSAVYMAPSQKTPRRKRAPRAAVDRIAQAFFHGSKSPSERHLPRYLSCLLATLSTTLIGFNTFFATNSLEGLLNTTSLTTSFVGIVLLPIFTNDLEPIKAAMNDDMDMTLQATVGKCVQAVLFVIPVIILLGWMMGIDEMKLSFDGFEVSALFASAIYISNLIMNGKSFWQVFPHKPMLWHKC